MLHFCVSKKQIREYFSIELLQLFKGKIMNTKQSYLDQLEHLLKLQSFNEMHSIKRFLKMDWTGIGVQRNIKIY